MLNVSEKWLPIKIDLSSSLSTRSEDPFIFLNNKPKLPNNIKVSLDKTTAQRSYFKSIKDTADKHNASHPENRKIIKHIKGIPTLTNANENTRPLN